MLVHSVVKGETLSRIAKDNGCSLAEIIRLNPGINPDKIQIGQILNMPDGKSSKTSQSTNKREFNVTNEQENLNLINYTIQKGDTLSVLAKKFGCTVAAIKAANNLKDDNIRAGAKLIIPTGNQETKPDKTSKTQQGNNIYTIQKGDTLSVLAKKFGCSIEALKAANNLKSDIIKEGAKLIIPDTKAEKIITDPKKDEEAFNTTSTIIKDREGKETKTYFAPEGKATIGYGHQLVNKPKFLKDIEAKKGRPQQEALLRTKLLNKNNVAELKACIEKDLKAAADNLGLTDVSTSIDNTLALSDEQIEMLMKSDLKIHREKVINIIGIDDWNKLTAKQQGVLCDISYNTKGFNAEKLPKLIHNGKIDEAQVELDFFYVTEDGIKKAQLGLIRRNYDRMKQWSNDGTICDEAKAKLLNVYNNVYCEQNGKRKVKDFEALLPILQAK